MSEHSGENLFSLSFTEAGKNNVCILSGNNECMSQFTMEQGQCCCLLLVGGTAMGIYVPTLQRTCLTGSFLVGSQTSLWLVLGCWSKGDCGPYIFWVQNLLVAIRHWWYWYCQLVCMVSACLDTGITLWKAEFSLSWDQATTDGLLAYKVRKVQAVNSPSV